MENENLKEVFSNLDTLLSKTDLKDVTSESTGYDELDDGYYLCEVEKANLSVSKTSGSPMVAFQFKVTDNGISIDEKTGDVMEIRNSKNRKIFMYFTLKDEASVKRFVNNMLKFEGDTPNKPVLEKEYFTNSQLIEDALDILVGLRIYIQISSTENEDGSKSVWRNLISWKRAAALELPM